MEFLGKLELFSRTVENRFIFNLFDLLLCGVIVLVILRGWRSRTRTISVRNQIFLLLAFVSLGASFSLGAVLEGAFLFGESRLPKVPFDLLIHTLQAGAWCVLAASAYHRPTRSPDPAGSPHGSSRPLWLSVPAGLHLAGLGPRLEPLVATAVDLLNVFLLAFVLALFYRRPLRGGKLATSALAFLLLAALLHLGSSWTAETQGSAILWNFEQFAWSLSLFTFALAIGEMSRDLFGRVFVRLQIAFILLASLMILVMTQTEKTEYVAAIQSRSDQLAAFVRAHVDYFQQRNEPLPAILEEEDFLQRLTLGFGSLPELKIVRILAESELATFEIADSGEIHRVLESLPPTSFPSRPDSDDYFVIHALSLMPDESGKVEFYGKREFLNRHIRKRILLIFSLFTGMVVLSTVMIGLVVSGASRTIRQQEQEIAETHRQLVQASKLAAVGELAAGVAHEINNPATTILSRASFLLSLESANPAPEDREDLEAIVAQAQRIAQITRGLLLFSRPQTFAIQPVPIDRVIGTSLHSVEPLFAGHHIRVEKNLFRNPPRVLADEASLVRALENIFRNAADAMPDGGTLTIRTAREDPAGTRLRVEIADTGIGIEGESLGRIFDPFFTTKEVGEGTGLGLSIAHGIIKEHKGTISVESQPGVGTRFTILLPTEY